MRVEDLLVRRLSSFAGGSSVEIGVSPFLLSLEKSVKPQEAGVLPNSGGLQ